MALQNVQNKTMNLVLSSDAKPRLKWTPELHQRFVDAVDQLGGADKATPKSLMRVLGIHGLTLYHLKSHLQKYRLGKSQQSQAYSEVKAEGKQHALECDIVRSMILGQELIKGQCDAEDRENRRSHLEICDGTQNQINESLQIAEALQMQMEVQRKLYEKIEVQRHLQLRIEAQGKYLQSVLKKAQEKLAAYNSSAVGVELAKEELSQLVSMVDIGCPSSSLSALTEIEGSISKDTVNKIFRGNGCTLESSLTSTESLESKEQTQSTDESDKWRRNSVVLSLMEMQPGQKSGSNNQANERKRSGSTIIDPVCVEQPSPKRFQSQKSGEQQKKVGFLETLDLNSKCLNDFDLGPRTLDLNCKGAEQSNAYI